MEKEKIIELIKEFGNCYVRNNDVDLEEISKEVGFEVEKRFAKNCEIGFVIEKKQKK